MLDIKAMRQTLKDMERQIAFHYYSNKPLLSRIELKNLNDVYSWLQCSEHLLEEIEREKS